MSTPFLILVSGLSCTGKSTLAQEISRHFNFPFFSKDMFKEIMFDRLGYSTREWSQQLGRTSYDILYLIGQNILKSGNSVILESNFKAEFDRPRLLSLQTNCPFTPIEILCHSDGKILFDRFRQRALSGLRHPGHVDQQCLDEQQQILSPGIAQPLNIGHLIKVDTSDFSQVNYQNIFDQIKSYLS